MENINITFIGCGNMGRSLIGGLIHYGYPARNLCGTDIDPAQRQRVAGQYGIKVLEDNLQAISGADVVVLCVKPQAMKDTLRPLQETLGAGLPLVISIAAGIRLQDLAHWAGNRLAIVRAMPNTPALVSTGASALCANAHASTAQRDTAEAILRSVGIVTWVENEDLIDAVTALSGSGPAYCFYLMEIMEKAGRELGLSGEQSKLLTLQTMLGAAKMALESSHDPGILRQQVTSPGGTTEKALEVLEQGKLEELIMAAMRAAYHRSQELAKTLGDPP